MQARAIPPLMGSGLLGQAPTGTGKRRRLIALPLLPSAGEFPRPDRPRPLRCWSWSPTRELAMQVGEAVSRLREGHGGIRPPQSTAEPAFDGQTSGRFRRGWM